MGKSIKVDTSGQNAAALMQAQLSKEQLDWAKQIYGETADERAAATATADQVSRSQLEAQNLQNKAAQAGYEDYTSTYRPLEQKLVGDAQAYDTPERRAAEAAAASADVETSIVAQRGATMHAMERSGVNPASGKVMAMVGGTGFAQLPSGAAFTDSDDKQYKKNSLRGAEHFSPLFVLTCSALFYVDWCLRGLLNLSFIYAGAMRADPRA